MFRGWMNLLLQPVSWLSLLLLVATGAGVIFYYDKQKKQHIEGTMVSLMLFVMTRLLSEVKHIVVLPVPVGLVSLVGVPFGLALEYLV